MRMTGGYPVCTAKAHFQTAAQTCSINDSNGWKWKIFKFCEDILAILYKRKNTSFIIGCFYFVDISACYKNVFLGTLNKKCL